MSKFKVGDRVKREPYGIGTIKIVSKNYYNNGNANLEIRWDGSRDIDTINDEENVELITTNNTTMNLKQKFTNLFLTEPEKSYRKAGITNSDGILTSEGQEIFLTYLLKKDTNFKSEVVDQLLKDEETNS